MCIIFQKGTERAGRYFGGEQDLSATGTSRAVLGCNFSNPHGWKERQAGGTCAFYYSSRIVTLILISRSKSCLRVCMCIALIVSCM